jgi:hypothetical protein
MIKLNFNIIPWIIAGVLALLLFLQRSCSRSTINDQRSTISDTIRIKGDTKLITVQDTVLKWKVKYYPAPLNTDSNAIIADYYRKFGTGNGGTIADTIKADDVTVAIDDSLQADSSIHRKVKIQNNRVKLVVTPPAVQKFKMFVGLGIGVNTKLSSAAVSPSLIFLTKNDNLYQLSYDVLSGTPMIGMSWKISFRGR